jgi:hypothetical protein
MFSTEYNPCGSGIIRKDTIKYLGTRLESKLYFHQHVDHGKPYRNFFLFLNFIPALTNLGYTTSIYPGFFLGKKVPELLNIIDSSCCERGRG